MGANSPQATRECTKGAAFAAAVAARECFMQACLPWDASSEPAAGRTHFGGRGLANAGRWSYRGRAMRNPHGANGSTVTTRGQGGGQTRPPAPAIRLVRCRGTKDRPVAQAVHAPGRSAGEEGDDFRLSVLINRLSVPRAPAGLRCPPGKPLDGVNRRRHGDPVGGDRARPPSYSAPSPLL